MVFSICQDSSIESNKYKNELKTTFVFPGRFAPKSLGFSLILK